MSAIESAFYDLGRLDRLARADTAVHRLDSRAKLIAVLVFTAAVVSFDKYAVAPLLPFFLFPAALAALGNVPYGYVAKKVLAVSPFAVMVGIFNPIFDREVLLTVGGVGVSGGWVSFASILVRFCLTISTAFILIAVTSFQGLCLGMQRLGAPRAFTVQMLFLYRYLFVLGEEALRLTRARTLRSFGARGTGLKAYGSLVGQLLLRTMARAQRIHLAMLSRGFDGEIHAGRVQRFGGRDLLFAAGWCALFALLRFVDVTALLGNLVLGKSL